MGLPQKLGVCCFVFFLPPSNAAATSIMSFLIQFVKTIILSSKQEDQWVDGD